MSSKVDCSEAIKDLCRQHNIDPQPYLNAGGGLEQLQELSEQIERDHGVRVMGRAKRAGYTNHRKATNKHNWDEVFKRVRSGP